MFHWKTKEIVDGLSQIPEIEEIDDRGPGGDVDTDNLIISMDGTDDTIHVCGFNVEDYDTATRASDTEVEMIELTDQSGIGLCSNEAKTALVFIKVRQYFVDRDATVVDSMDQYF